MMKSAIRNPQSAFLPFPAFSSIAAFSALFLMLCCQARAQERPNGSPNGQKSPERAVPASAELLKKAMKNARAIAPDDTQEHMRPVETKTPPNSTQADSHSLQGIRLKARRNQAGCRPQCAVRESAESGRRIRWICVGTDGYYRQSPISRHRRHERRSAQGPHECSRFI